VNIHDATEQAYKNGYEAGLIYAEQMIENYINNRTSFFSINYICGLIEAQIIVRQIRRGKLQDKENK